MRLEITFVHLQYCAAFARVLPKVQVAGLKQEVHNVDVCLLATFTAFAHDGKAMAARWP